MAGRRAAAGGTRAALSGAAKENLAVAHKIPLYVAAAMLTVALILDMTGFFVGLIPIIGVLLLTKMVTLVAIPLFGVWFALSGVTLLSGERVGLKVVSMFAGIVIETVPILDMLPGIFAGVLGIIIATRLEGVAKAPTAAPAAKLKFGGPQKVGGGEVPHTA